ncbi:porin family protein [Pontibacter harenae]|uniref:porin family protein n=1 Tax=Pontibacter harenae TaxID=2894083 RepID=UPI001E41288E|nr:porin family protein [Pontibacter harenae]MCC9168361.1 PorT family protein [Pontibacter harenae]
MKKGLLLFFFAFIAAFATHAQGIGVRVGANYAGFEGNDADMFERKLGFHAGLYTSIPLVDNFLSVRPEVLYSMKGAKLDDANDVKLNLSYIDVPVLAHVNAGPIYFEGGPQFSVRVGENIKADDNTVTSDLDGFRRTSFGYAAGVGFATPLGLNIGVRYNGDFSKLYDDNNAADVRNGVFLLTVGFLVGGR